MSSSDDEPRNLEASPHSMASEDTSNVVKDSQTKNGDNSLMATKEEYIIEPKRTNSEESASETDTVTAKAKESGKALKDLIESIARKTRQITLEKTEQLKQAANDEQTLAVQDSREIQRLGTLVDGILKTFDDTMDTVGREPYDVQEKMLIGFRKVLEEEVNVINARMSMAKRLAPAEIKNGARATDQELPTSTEPA